MERATETNILSAIPPEAWEQALPIGKFRAATVLAMMHRPFSDVARCQIRGDSGQTIVYVKKYCRKEGRPEARHREKMLRDIEASRFWYDHFRDSPQFKVVKPVLALPEHFITVTEETPGESLFVLLQRQARIFAAPSKQSALEKHLFHVGGWLKHKQDIMWVPEARYSIDELLDYLTVRLDILTEDPRRRFPSHYREQILNFIEDFRGRLTDEDFLVTTNHSDFNPGNIIVNGKTVTVLDFGRLVTGSYLLDLSKLHFQLHLFTFKPQYRHATIARLQQALANGFGRPAIAENLMFQFLMVRHILTHLANVTRFWKFGFKERWYNTWAMNRERNLLDRILNGTPAESAVTKEL